jgi:hypothetical protein
MSGLGIPEKAAAHLEHLLARLLFRFKGKYIEGQQKHGGILSERSVLGLLEEAENEALDQMAYIPTARDNVLKAWEEAGLGIRAGCDHCRRVRDVLGDRP